MHSKNGKLKFPRSKEGLYFHKFNDSYKKLVEKKNTRINCSNTVEDNMEGFSTWQIERARKSRQLLHALGAPKLKKLQDGTIDIIIGTHALIFDDIIF